MIEQLSPDCVALDIRNIHARVGMRAMIRSLELAGEAVNEDLRKRLDELDEEQAG